ncbi:MAG: adenylate/guanylate cyclase domain-containing protein, partial [Acidobacteriota bacterium]
MTEPSSSDSLRSAEQRLRSFVPPVVRRRLLEADTPPDGPVERRFGAAILFADLTGFTPFAERLARRGAAGAELVKDSLNACFGRLVDRIHQHGGEVLVFAGDAVVALWDGGDGLDGAKTHGDGLDGAAMRAARCGLELQAAMEDLPAELDGGLRLRVGVGAGEVWAAVVGGHDGRWELLVTGPPLHEATRAESLADPGRVVLGPSVHRRLGNPDELRPLPAAPDFALLTSSAAPPPAAAPEPSGALPELVLRSFVPRAVQAHLDAGQLQWLAEYRQVTVLFLNVRGLDYGGEGALPKAQDAIRAVQQACYHYRGSITQALVDDKGTVVIAGWGLALHSHEDDALRALLAALRMRRLLADLGLGAGIGVATGRVFNGLRGGAEQREFALVGDVVNLAARLMVASGDGILSDGPTRFAARQRVAFDELPPLTLKGKSRPVPVWRPLGVKDRRAGKRIDLVGRTAETQRLAAALELLVQDGSGGVVVIEGEAGIGKSKLVLDFQARAWAAKASCLVGGADALDQRTLFYAWRSIFRRLLHLEGGGDGSGAHSVDDPVRRLEALCGDSPKRSWVPLLGPILGFKAEENDVTRGMSAEGRAEGTRDLLVHLFRSAPEGASVVVLEDAQWLDSPSWALAETMARQCEGLLLVLATRPVPERELPQAAGRLLEGSGTERLRLEALPPEEAVALACSKLGVEALPDAVTRLVRNKAEGHPLFTEELVYALRDRGVLRIEDGRCDLTLDAGELAAAGVPDTVQGVVTSRIDRLGPSHQLSLKVASTLGRRFDLDSLRQVHPLDPEPADLARQLDDMVRLEILQAPGDRNHYSFQHPVTMEVVYGLLAPSQRRQLHGRIAGWLEQTADDDPGGYPRLAEHWSRAGDRVKALEWLEKAGEVAARQGVHREAAVYFHQVLTLAGVDPAAATVDAEGEVHLPTDTDLDTTPQTAAAPEPPTAVKLARWHRQLGYAHYGLGNYQRSRRQLESATDAAGRPVPADGWRLGVSTLREVGRQVRHSLWGPRRDRGDAAARTEEAALSFDRLASIYYLGQQPERTLHSLLVRVNLAERVPESATRVTAYSGISFLYSILGLGRLSRRYRRLAIHTGRQLEAPLATAQARFYNAIQNLGLGAFERVLSDLEMAKAAADRLGERELQLMSLNAFANYEEI